jgi:hypothetical protein
MRMQFQTGLCRMKINICYIRLPGYTVATIHPWVDVDEMKHATYLVMTLPKWDSALF